MVTGSSDHFDSDAYPARHRSRNSSFCLLDSDPRTLLPANDRAWGRGRSSALPKAARDSRETLAAELEAIVGQAGRKAAHDLLARFGSIGRVMSASQEALSATLGTDNPAIDAIRAANSLVRMSFEEQLVGKSLEVSDPLLHNHLRAQLLCSDVERLYVIFLSRRGLYLGGELVAVGSRRGLMVSIRAIVHRALDTNAAAILLAHNHPSGDCRPSAQDIEQTRQLVTILDAIELFLVDHLIVCNQGIYSLEKGKEL